MRYEGTIYRPPSEWQSYILQVTIGCSHNACTFCGMFKDKKYRVRPLQDILEDIDLAKQRYGSVHQVFLCDGDAISLDTGDLLKILHKLKRTFPELQEISTYAGPKSTLKKSREELLLLREAGLTKAYLGVESGDEQVLKETCKGVNVAQMLEAGKNLVSAGMELYAIILIGLAGKARSTENAIATADIINRMQPAHLTAMTYMPVPGTKMYRDIENGKFEVLDTTGCLRETRTLVEHITLEQLHFLSNHASNYVSIDGFLPKDREKILDALDQAIHQELPVRDDARRGL
jgi:radical SAM superfamily enzyme YgiQ (UPF0313 family)